MTTAKKTEELKQDSVQPDELAVDTAKLNETRPVAPDVVIDPHRDYRSEYLKKLDAQFPQYKHTYVTYGSDPRMLAMDGIEIVMVDGEPLAFQKSLVGRVPREIYKQKKDLSHARSLAVAKSIQNTKRHYDIEKERNLNIKAIENKE